MRFDTNIEKIRKNPLQKNNTSGYTGVYRDPRSGNWQARITFQGKVYSLGAYKNIEDAAATRKIAEDEIWGNFLEWYDKWLEAKKRKKTYVGSSVTKKCIICGVEFSSPKKHERTTCSKECSSINRANHTKARHAAGTIKSSAIDLTGQRFGNLTVIKRSDEKKGTSVLWECICDCGNATLASTSKLRSGDRTSCGCKRRVAIDITGQKYGRLEAIQPTNKRSSNGSVIWICRCECGKEKHASINELKHGLIKSCGCLIVDLGRKRVKEMNTKNKQFNTNIGMLTNKNLRADNTSGVTGVYYNNNKQKWAAGITLQGKYYFLGFYDDIAEATRARKLGEELIFGEFLEWYDEWIKDQDKTKAGEQ
ncbi:hypothetical protein LJC61_09375 [Ruminococcaceae bacterium OttesenSCG-928-A16]|nr:hypothetical protein [Ruminococcaceae bacterium OttesenSCG-928-A16]